MLRNSPFFHKQQLLQEFTLKPLFFLPVFVYFAPLDF